MSLYGHLTSISSLLIIKILNLSPITKTEKSSSSITTSSITNSTSTTFENYLISGSTDGMIRIWDMKNGNCLFVLTEHTNAIQNLIYYSQTKLLISSSLDETIRIWDLSPKPKNKVSSKELMRSLKTIPCKGSTGVGIIDSLLIIGGVGSLSLYSLSTFYEVKKIVFESPDQKGFDPSLIINRIMTHDMGIVFDYGRRIKVFHFSEMPVKKKQ